MVSGVSAFGVLSGFRPACRFRSPTQNGHRRGGQYRRSSRRRRYLLERGGWLLTITAKKQLSRMSRGKVVRRPPGSTVLEDRVEDREQLAHAGHQRATFFGLPAARRRS